MVDDFHQVRRQHRPVVGRKKVPWMGKADIQGRGVWLKNRPPGCGGIPLGTGVETGGNFHHHQPEQGHGDQEGTRMGHVTSTGKTQTLKQSLRRAGFLGERPRNCTSRNKIGPGVAPGREPRSIARVRHAHPLAREAIACRASAVPA